MKGYTTWGSVRGCSGDRHKTREAAEKAVARDQASCARLGGGAYSDRITAVIGDDDRLYRDDECTDPIPGPGGMSCGAARWEDAREAKAKRHRDLYNESGDGYNPYEE